MFTILMRWAGRALAVLGALWLVVTLTPVLEWWIAPLSWPWDDAAGETLIVLGSEVHADGAMGYHSYLRALHALRVYRRHGFQHVVVTAGNGVALAIRDYLVGNGIPPDRVTVETESHSTREDALFTARIIGNWPGRKVLVTSDIHTFRAYRVFRKAGLELRTSPAPDAGKSVNTRIDRWGVFLDLCLETLKVSGYWARGWI